MLQKLKNGCILWEMTKVVSGRNTYCARVSCFHLILREHKLKMNEGNGIVRGRNKVCYDKRQTF